ncbi:MAG: hypothetical protein JWP97_4307 [Labilithrix sp.]|nr:hypothetical protein [Labilithrix sp.]
MTVRSSLFSMDRGSLLLGSSRTRDVAVRVARAAGLLLAACTAFDVSPAAACGGAFFPDVEQTVAVSGHQMAISISRTQTVVWDRLEVQGNPSELAWVIPVHEGAKLELSSEAWFTSLANVTAPTVSAYEDSGSSGGCACGSADTGAALGSAAGERGTQVIERKDIGPYDVARLRATEPGAVRTWLVANGFAIPAEVGPVLDEYTTEGFDFIALRVRPGATAAGLQPLRLTTPGTDATLPLRMSRAGVKSEAALTLYVLGEGRYRVQGFEELEVDRNRLTFDVRTQTSNYEAVVAAQLAGDDGRRFVVEHAADDYRELRQAIAYAEGACASGNGPVLGGNDDADAGDAGAEAGADAGAPDPSAPLTVATCASADLAATGSGASNVLWVTRLRARLPTSVFDRDLRLEASPTQTSVSGSYLIAARGGGAMVAPARPSSGGSLVLFGATVAGLSVLLRRRRSVS